MESPAVEQLILKGLRKLPSTGAWNFSELEAVLNGRTARYYGTRFLPATGEMLADALGVETEEIDWNELLPAVREVAEDFEVTNLIEASKRDRYLMFLDMLANEASALPSVMGAAEIDASAADGILYDHVM